MTYTVYEASRKTGAPIDLYLIRVGTGANSYYAYTNHEQVVNYDDGSGMGTVAYQPIAITRGKITSSGSLDKTRMDITIPNTVGLALFLKDTLPSVVIGCTIYQGHSTDPDAQFVVGWVGRILAAKNQKQQAQMLLTGEPTVTAMKRTGLRRNWQIGCPHWLYDQEEGSCRADQAHATVVGVVAAASGATVTMTAGWNGAFAREKFRNGGRLEWDTVDGDHEIRTIRQVNDDQLVLNAPVRGLVAGMSADVILGCNHQSDDCENLHVEAGTGIPNIVNYGGQKWIPLSSPFGLRNNYY